VTPQEKDSFVLTVEEAQLLCTSSVPMTQAELTEWDELRDRLRKELAAEGHSETRPESWEVLS
jgi:hypothetical protein